MTRNAYKCGLVSFVYWVDEKMFNKDHKQAQITSIKAEK